ncbi:MAG: LysR family transcriptional regulator [Planctomycetia bacterium]|nr:LysR family transcriptional regulator [Planctomycetia bacterium]
MRKTLYYKGIQLPQLRSFCTVAAQGSFSAAAKVLGLSKPTVWQQVRALERELKVTLVKQGERGIELTAEGQLLLKLIQPHVSGLDSLVRLFETQRAELQQTLTIVSTPYLISHHLPAVIEDYAVRHPSVRLHLRTDAWTDHVVGLIDQRHADLGIAPYLRDETRQPTLEYVDLFDLQFTLLTARHHPLSRKRRVTPEDLVQFPIIKASSYNQRALEALLRRHNLLERMHVVMETGSTDIILKYVALGIGVAVLYMGGKEEPPPSGVHARPFDTDETAPLTVAMMVRKGAYLAEHVQDFCQTVRRLLAE